jgi:hypothetical protein
MEGSMRPVSLARRAVWVIGVLGVPVHMTTGLAQQVGTVDVTGQWTLSIRTPEGRQPRTLDVVMAKDGSITGTVGAPFGSLPISSGRFAHDTLRVDFAMASGQIGVTFQVLVRGDSLRGTYRQDQWVGEVVGARATPDAARPPGPVAGSAVRRRGG